MNKKTPVNAPCPCGSGLKFKKCCGKPSASHDLATAVPAKIPLDSGVSASPKNVRLRSRPIDPKSPCPCGSRKTYGSCCKAVLAQYGSIDSLTKEESMQWEAGDIGQLEVLYRAHFVHYLQWIYEHTLPAVAVNMPRADELVELDKDALVHLVDTIARFKAKLNRSAEIVPFLDHVEAIVPLHDFAKDVAFVRATWLYVALEDAEGARREFAKLGSIHAYKRREAKEVYLDVFGDQLSDREKIALAEQIVAQAEKDDAVRIQYTSLRAICLLEIGEANQGFEALGTLLEGCARLESSDDVVTVLRLAKAWALYGKFKSDAKALRKAEELLLRVPENELTRLGKAALLLDLGWVLRDREKYPDAASAFRRSLELDPATVTKIHLSHALALCGETDMARELQLELEGDDIEQSLRLEYFAAKASLAIAATEIDLAREIIEGLRQLPIEHPFWREQRDQLIIEMFDFVSQPTSARPATRQRSILKLLLFANDIVELKPRLFGVGVNVNKVIEKFISRFDH